MYRYLVINLQQEDVSKKIANINKWLTTNSIIICYNYNVIYIGIYWYSLKQLFVNLGW